jgi:phosphoribosylanthranilate isomerase
VAELLNSGDIDLAQLHGHEDADYIMCLKRLTDKPIIQAFRIESRCDVERAVASIADYVLLDAGAGAGKTFEWKLAQGVRRPFFLAGGLTPENAALAV